MRKHGEFKSSCGCVKTVVLYAVPIQEYVVKYYVDGKVWPNCSYYTTDKDDAISTAKLMAEGKHPNAYL